MSFYVYENWRINPDKAKIHLGICIDCNFGKGKNHTLSTKNGQRLGPFSSYKEVLVIAKNTNRPVTNCHHCFPKMQEL